MSNASSEWANPYCWEDMAPLIRGTIEEDLGKRIERLQQVFPEATGWEVKWLGQRDLSGKEFAPTAEGYASETGAFCLTSGKFRKYRQYRKPNDSAPLDPSKAPQKGQPPKAVRQLAEEVASLLEEIHRLQQTVWQREAELATGVPVVAAPEHRATLARRLEAVLRAGVEAVGADAAGVYLLDEGTSCLKLRAVWGLPIRKLADPPRPLRGALADLEALLGHVVVLTDLGRIPSWESPEPGFGAAVCVPISTQTTLLGTLWIFSKQKRDFTSQQTNILEVVAGRIATELEREVLLAETVALKPWKEHLYQLQQWQEEQAARIAPGGQGWEIGRWQDLSQAGWGEFFQQFSWGPGQVGLVLGRVQQEGIRAVLEAVRVSALLEAYACQYRRPHRLLQQVLQTLALRSGAPAPVAVWVGRLTPSPRNPPGKVLLQYASKGPVVLMRISAKGRKTLLGGWTPRRRQLASAELDPTGSLPPQSRLLGQTVAVGLHRCWLQRGEVVLVFSYPESGASGEDGYNFSDLRGQNSYFQQVAETVRKHLDWPAARLAELVQKVFPKATGQGLPMARSLCVLKAR